MTKLDSGTNQLTPIAPERMLINRRIINILDTRCSFFVYLLRIKNGRKAVNHIKPTMKKIALVLTIASVIGTFSSCKPKEKCPAYGKYVPSQEATKPS